MSTAFEHARTVLSGIIPDRLDLLESALTELSSEFFEDRDMKALFLMLQRVYDITSSVMTLQMMKDQLQDKVDFGKLAKFESLFELLESKSVLDSDFVWSVFQLKEISASKNTAKALTEAMQVLNHGIESEKGEELRGHEASRSLLLERFSFIERDLNKSEAPEGNIILESDSIVADYESSKVKFASGVAQGVLFGVPELDSTVKGLQRGELDLVVGSSSSGKTSLVCNQAWYACVEQGLNVVYLTSETLRVQIRRKIIARHSKHEKFGSSQGLDTRDLRNGTLSEEDEKLFRAVVKDFTSGDYGKFQLAQLPKSSTVSTVDMYLNRYSKNFPLDLCIIDYLNLLHAEKKRGTDWEEKNHILKSAKQLATTHNKGSGIPIVSPWQVTRASHEKADQRGYYDMSALAETAEATNSSDVIVSILEPTVINGRHTTLTGQVLKNRDGPQASELSISVDYATSYFSSQSSSPSSFTNLFN